MKKSNNAPEAATKPEVTTVPEVAASELMNINACNAITHPALREETLRLVELYKRSDDDRRQVCRILWHILSEKLYEKGGFKSLEEYAKSINIPDKSNAHKFAEAGKILAHYDAKAAKGELTAEQKSFVENTGWTAMHKLAKSDLNKLDAAVDSGDVKASVSVKDADEWAHKNLNELAQKRADRKSSPVVKRYALKGYIYGANGVSEVNEPDCIPEDVEAFKGFTFARVKCGDLVEYVGYNPETCALARYELSSVAVEEKPKSGGMNCLKAALAKLTPEQRAALLAEYAE